jgi:hypothetical protein
MGLQHGARILRKRVITTGTGSGKPEMEMPGTRGDVSPAFSNFIDVIRSGKDEDLLNPITGGHYSAPLAHLANISWRLGGKELQFDGAAEKFVKNRKADALLTRKGGYRDPYVVPDKV